MANDYPGSIAQQYISFSTTISATADIGAGFGKAMIFVDSASISGMWTGTPPQPGTDFELTSATYANYLTGGLLNWATGFFATNSIGNLYIAAYDGSLPANAGITATYSGVKYDAYFKTVYTAGLITEALQNAACVALAQLCQPDTGKFSQAGFGTSFVSNLDPNSVLSLTYGIKQSTGDALVVYAASGSSNPWLDQVGLSLSLLNASGTTVGNALDYFRTSNRLASGAAGANLLPADVAALTGQKVGYWATVGNSTGAVALYNPTTVKGNYAGANWIAGYIDYLASVKSSEYLTDPASPGRRRNNDTYQGVLNILNATAQPFTDKGGSGALANFQITAPVFSKLTGGGSTLIIPNAWKAQWLQGVHTVTVQGTLTIQG